MFRPAPGTVDARTLHGELLKKGIIIRSLKAYQLPEWLRVSMGTDEENELFLKYTKEILGA
jgi:histidinol-phosphate aminotransferase